RLAEVAPALSSERTGSFGCLIFGAALLHGERLSRLRRQHQRAREHGDARTDRNGMDRHGKPPKVSLTRHPLLISFVFASPLRPVCLGRLGAGERTASDFAEKPGAVAAASENNLALMKAGELGTMADAEHRRMRELF